ncbi:MAG: dihydroorotase family protein [Planctomycetes bacterium]|nr:dihydroorotase family protein [Planctomycetota bacterium]
MEAQPTLFRGGRLFDGDRFIDATDLRTDGLGRISELGTDLEAQDQERVVELGGRWLLPGLVDCHVHFREPGLVRKEGYLTGSAGALHGGVTTVCEIQNNPPLMETGEVMRKKLADLRGVSRVDYAPYGSLTEASLPTLHELVGLCPAVKCFLGCSTGAGGVKDEATMRALFARAAEVGIKIVAHCEDNRVMDAAAESAEGDQVERHDYRRPVEAEVQSVRDAIRVADEVGAVLHVFHISTAEGGRLVAEARAAGQPVTGTTAPHYLIADAEEAAAIHENRFKVNPSIKSIDNQRGLREMVGQRLLEGVGTDHAPHPLEEKARPYAKAPAGFPSIDLLLPLLIAIADDADEVSLEAALASVTRIPADEFGLSEKGRLVVGADADLVITDPGAHFVVDEATLPSKSKWSPYHGRELRARPDKVWLRRRLVNEYGQEPAPPQGQPVGPAATALAPV